MPELNAKTPTFYSYMSDGVSSEPTDFKKAYAFFEKGQNTQSEIPEKTLHGRRVGNYPNVKNFEDPETGNAYSTREELLTAHKHRNKSSGEYPKCGKTFEDPETGKSYASKEELLKERKLRSNPGFEQKRRSSSEYPKCEKTFEDSETGKSYVSKEELRKARNQRANEKFKSNKRSSDQNGSHFYKVSAKTGSRQYWMEILNAVLNDRKNGVSNAIVVNRLNVVLSKLNNGSYKFDPKIFNIETFISLLADDLALYESTHLTKEIVESLKLYEMLIPERLFGLRQCFDAIPLSKLDTKKPYEIMEHINWCLKATGSQFRLSLKRMEIIELLGYSGRHYIREIKEALKPIKWNLMGHSPDIFCSAEKLREQQQEKFDSDQHHSHFSQWGHRSHYQQSSDYDSDPGFGSSYKHHSRSNPGYEYGSHSHYDQSRFSGYSRHNNSYGSYSDSGSSYSNQNHSNTGYDSNNSKSSRTDTKSGLTVEGCWQELDINPADYNYDPVTLNAACKKALLKSHPDKAPVDHEDPDKFDRMNKARKFLKEKGLIKGGNTK